MQNNPHKSRVNCSWAKVQHRFQLGLCFCSFSWGNITYGEIAFLCVSNLMRNFFGLYKKRASAPALQIPPEPLFLLYMNSQFHYFEKRNMRETNGNGCSIQRNERLSSPSMEIRCMGLTFESLSGSDGTWRLGNLQFARGVVSMLCLQGRILTRPPAAVCLASPPH